VREDHSLDYPSASQYFNYPVKYIMCISPTVHEDTKVILKDTSNPWPRVCKCNAADSELFQ